MNYFSTDQFEGFKTQEDHRCKCGALPKLSHKMLNPRRGTTIRMFECGCGERTWTEDRD